MNFLLRMVSDVACLFAFLFFESHGALCCSVVPRTSKQRELLLDKSAFFPYTAQYNLQRLGQEKGNTKRTSMKRKASFHPLSQEIKDTKVFATESLFAQTCSSEQTSCPETFLIE